MRNELLRNSVLIGLMSIGLVPVPAHAQTAGNVLVVVNVASADSVRLGDHYAKVRRIPAEQVLRLDALPAEPTDGIDRQVFDRAISGPIAAWLARHQAQDRIHFIVLTKGIPLRINGGADNSAASVDSELSVLYLRLTGARVETTGPMPNPYFLGDRPVGEARRFSRNLQQLYLVTRLDGFTVADVIALIDRGITPSRAGRFVLDGKASLRERGNAWLQTAVTRLKAQGIADDRIVSNQSSEVITDQVDILGYYSWGSNDPAIRRRHFNHRFVAGAIGGMFVSTDGRTFREPPKGWKLPGWENKASWHAGTPQSLAGDLIREGITGVSGHVAEPLLGNTVRPDILFPAYVAGFTLAEAYYLAMPSVSWMTVVVGDPLCAPFADVAPPFAYQETLDPTTELPSWFSQRRVAALSGQGPPEAIQALLRAESRQRRQDVPGARADLERATALAPTLVSAHYLLAGQYEAAGEIESAVARYRKVLELSPDSVPAMNNLAYLLANRQGNLRDAQPLAERAAALAPASGPVIDTLGWIVFMSGDARRAVALLARAAVLAPETAEIHLHLAQAQSAAGNPTAAKTALERALALDPSLSARPEVRSLRGQ